MRTKTSKCLKCGRPFTAILTTFAVMLCDECLDVRFREVTGTRVTDDEPSLAWGSP